MVAVGTFPYIIPLFLGMTYDMRNTKPGIDIYDQKFVDDPAVTTPGTAESNYKVCTSSSDVQKILDVSGDLSLKIKTGMVDIKGKGGYLKNERDFSTTVEILTKMVYTSRVIAFKQDAQPRSNWVNEHAAGVLGTHYVSEVIYGAEMIASARFVASNSSYTSDIKGEVEATFGAGGSGNNLTAEGKLEMLEKKLKGKSHLEISYYGTVPLLSIPNTIDGLRTLISKFKEQVEQTDQKKGVPISVKLSPLTELVEEGDRSKFEFLKNIALERALAEFEGQLDELRKARLDLTSWTKGLPYDLKPEYEQEIGDLIRNITKVTQLYYDVVWKMDLTKGKDQLKNATDAYDYNGRPVYNRYAKRVRALIAKLKPLIQTDIVNSYTYTQWGHNKCTESNAITLYDGFVVSSSEQDGYGGSAHYMCAPKSPKKGYDLTEVKKSLLSGKRHLKFEKNSNPFNGTNAKDISEQGIPCARCYSPDSASITMFSAKDSCPLTWYTMYTGYLMASRNEIGITTEYVCVDINPSGPYKMDPQPWSKETMALTTIQTEGSLPKDLYKNGALVRCAVCAMKSNQVNF